MPEELEFQCHPIYPICVLISEEVWKPIPGFEDRYEASTFGRIKSMPRDIVCADGRKMKNKSRILKPQQYNEYLSVRLYCNGNFEDSTYYSIHSVILETFVHKRPGNLICRHLDDNKHNNHILNLTWGTFAQNAKDYSNSRKRSPKNSLAKRKRIKKSPIAFFNIPCYIPPYLNGTL